MATDEVVAGPHVAISVRATRLQAPVVDLGSRQVLQASPTEALLEVRCAQGVDSAAVALGSLPLGTVRAMADHYAEAFFVQPGSCWRMISASDGTGHPTHCPETPVWRGRWQDGAGKWWPKVESCDGHAEELLDVRRIRPGEPS